MPRVARSRMGRLSVVQAPHPSLRLSCKPPECRTAISRIESRAPRGSSLFGSGFRLARGYCRPQLLANAAIAASRVCRIALGRSAVLVVP
jgi:hypothetical protein